MATLKTFTTDKAVYTIEQHTQRRVDEFVDGVAVWVEYPQYNVMLDGKMICFCYDENEIPMMVDCQENPERNNVGSRFD